ncbi:MAG: inositol monophosphatase family protein [Angustibacter sp.]
MTENRATSSAGPPSAQLLAELLDLATRAALDAGTLIRDGRPDDLRVAATKSSPTDVVTEMDQQSEQLLRERLLGARPQDGMLGEEGADVAGSSGITWVVDPIDGTVNYLYGIPAYAVCVAAVTGDPTAPAGHQVVVGVVHHPLSGETFTATLDGGAFLGDRPLHVPTASSARGLDQALVGTGFGYDRARRARQGELVAKLLPHVRDIRRFGSAALDLCQVACGRLDAYYERGLNPWDLAAGGLIARQAGALVTGLSGAPAGPDLVVAAPADLHRQLLELIGPWRPDVDTTALHAPVDTSVEARVAAQAGTSGDTV